MEFLAWQWKFFFCVFNYADDFLKKKQKQVSMTKMIL